MKRVLFVAMLVAVYIAGDVRVLLGADQSGPGQKFNKPENVSGLPTRSKLNINNLSAWYDSDGTEEINSSTGNSGVTFPKGTATCVFSSGLMWSGIWQDGRTPELRTNGHSYNTGFRRGAILGFRTGVTEDPGADDVRIWRVRRNFATADLSEDAADINSIALSAVTPDQINEVRDQYLKDWLEWPVAKGAPFYDADSDGMYAPVVLDGVPTLYPDADEPGLADADQVIWYVANDIGVAQPWTNIACGMEVQATYWAYARTDELGNVIFKKYRIIYKGTNATPPDAVIDDFYLSQWSDVDLGEAGDDFAGCDVDLSLGYVYNGVSRDPTYDDFGLVPPSTGYDFLQGPRVFTGNPADTAIFNLQKISGYINLPMTAFVYFAAGGTYSDPPFTPGGGIQWNQMLRGLPPIPQGPPDPAQVIDPSTGQTLAGNFWLYGDPTTRSGWIDGSIEAPGDRRIILASGPFTMALGDTQELVSALVAGHGISNISSVAHLKFVDQSVQGAYDNFFKLPKAPSAPNLTGTVLDREIILDWSDPEAVAETEIPITLGYSFEGYNIYQFPSAAGDLANAERIATFDVVNGVTTILQSSFDLTSGVILKLPKQLGSDSGIDHFLSITEDLVRGGPLVNGQPVYLAVTAYNVSDNPDNVIQSLESPPVVLTLIPESPPPGTRTVYAVDDSLPSVNTAGTNDAIVYGTVYNPGAHTGEDLNRNGILDPGEDLNGNGIIDPYTYNVTFSVVGTAPSWTLANMLTQDTLYEGIPLGLDGSVGYRVGEAGFSLSVFLPPAGLENAFDQNGNALFGPESENPNYAVLSPDGTTEGISGFNIASTSFEIRFDGTETYALRLPGNGAGPIPRRIPFTAWNTGANADTAIQVYAAFTDRDTSLSWTLLRDSLVLDDVPYPVFEQFAITIIPYVDTTNMKTKINQIFPAATQPGNPNSGVLLVHIADLDGDGIAAPQGDTIRFSKFTEIKDGDAKVIAPNKLIIGDAAAAADDVTEINVFPNPYYGLNLAEINRVNRFVTFNHLPAQATIRIFNVAGVLVRTLQHPDATSSRGQFMDWDLQNDSGLPVASGMYIAYIEMRDIQGADLGKKVLKLAIIQEQQFLRNY